MGQRAIDKDNEMYKPGVTESVPLNNGKETKPAPAAKLKTSVYLPDGSCVTLQEIVKNKESYDGKTITKEKKTVSTKGNYEIVVKDKNVYLSGAETNLHLNPKFGFGSMDLTKNPAALKDAISSTSHPMKSKMVAMTELSVVYGPTGSGKTLVTLSDIRRSILDKTIRGEDVVYVNLDDSPIGLAEKAELLAEPKVKMIKEFNIMMLYSMIDENVAKGKVIIIDTVKKIVNLMNKAEVADLMKHLKKFTHEGGTVSLIAHANKHPGPDGLPVLEGVGDLKNDADCVVRVQRHKDIITMSNEKSRSYVEQEAIFQTLETKDYKLLMHSIQQLGGQDAIDLKEQREQECFKEDNCRLIETITEMIGIFPAQKTKLVKDLIEDTGLSRRFLVTTLELLEGDLWDLEKGPNNSKNYSLRTNDNPNKKVEDDEDDVKDYLIREGYIPRDEDPFPIALY